MDNSKLVTAEVMDAYTAVAIEANLSRLLLLRPLGGNYVMHATTWYEIYAHYSSYVWYINSLLVEVQYIVEPVA